MNYEKYQNLAVLIFIVFLLFLISKSAFFKSAEEEYFNIALVDTCSTDHHNLAVSKQGIYAEFFLDGEFFFSNSDISRYAESIVLPPLNILKKRGNSEKISILFIGYPCGYTLNTLLKATGDYRERLIDVPVSDVLLKEYLASSEFLSDESRKALISSRINFIELKKGEDFKKNSPKNPGDNPDFELMRHYVDSCKKKYDFIIVNSPDPINEKTEKWYSLDFYKSIKERLNSSGLVSQQITSPFFTPSSLGMIQGRIGSVFSGLLKFRTNIPSTGEWGFAYFSEIPLTTDMTDKVLDTEWTYMNRDVLKAGFHFPKDKKELISLGRKRIKETLNEVYFKEWQSYVKMSDFE